jgi:hypothetical protein
MRSKAKTYSPGDFEWLVTISEQKSTPNEYNEPEIMLVPVAEVWAKKQYQSGREFYAGTAGMQGSKVAQEVVMFTFRYVEGLNEQMFISDDEGEYNITRISAMNRNQYHQVIAQRDAT